MAKTSGKKTVKAAQPSATTTAKHSHEALAWRAYELYLARGGDHGNDLDDWLQAEQELTKAQS